MAFFDSPEFLLSSIRHSFITCDDTGMCEMVMLSEAITLPASHFPSPDDYYGSSDFLEAGGCSYDILSDMAMIGAHRRRSNTAQRLDKLKKEKKEQANVKTVCWKDPAGSVSGEDLEQLFPKKSVPSSKAGTKKSILTEQLARHPTLPTNPFNEYARFNGKVNEGMAVKKLQIYLPSTSEEHSKFPLEVEVLCSARVMDLIGLICWQYTANDMQPPLKPAPNRYCLRIVEESGEVDLDFPSLDPHEPVAKFDFPVMALVEREDFLDSSSSGGDTIVTLYSDEGFSKIQLPSLDVTLAVVLEQTLKHRKEETPESQFRLERKNHPGISLDLNTSVADAGCLEFRLVCLNNGPQSEGPSSNPNTMLVEVWSLQSVLEAPLYQAYTVVMVHQLGRSTEVQLGVSSEKVELTPLTAHHKSPAVKLWTRQFKPITYNLDSIAACEMVNKKCRTGKAMFKLVYAKGPDFKQHLFETETYKAQEIVRKLQYILQTRVSKAQKDYLASK